MTLEIVLSPEPAPVGAQPAAEPPSASVSATPPPPPIAPTDHSADLKDGSMRRDLGLGMGVAGVVAVGFAGYFGIHTLSLVSRSNPSCPNDDCTQSGASLRDSARGSQTAGFVLAGAGAALLGAGAIVYFGAPKGGATRSGAGVSMTVTANGASGRFRW